jgi:hypothetical protein
LGACERIQHNQYFFLMKSRHHGIDKQVNLGVVFKDVISCINPDSKVLYMGKLYYTQLLTKLQCYERVKHEGT